MSYNYKIKGIVINTIIKWLVRTKLFVAYIGRGWSLPNVKQEEKKVSGWWVLFWLRWFHIYPSLSLQVQLCLIVSFFFKFIFLLVWYWRGWNFTPLIIPDILESKKRKQKSFLKCLFVKHQISRPAPFLCLMGRGLPGVAGSAERTLPAGLFTDCKSTCYWCSFLYLNFYCIFYDSVVVYISIFWKRDIFWKTYYSGFLVANFAFFPLIFFVTLFTILPKPISFDFS